MGQLTVYIDDETRARIERAATEAGVSVSSWVKEKLSRCLETEWPDGYFALFGSLAESDLERPPQLEAGLDREREALE